MIPDYHMHTWFSGDSDADPHSMVERAMELGMDQICITDHCDTESEDKEFVLDTEAYIPYMKKLKEEYKGRIDVRIGVEIGMQPHLSAYHQEYLKQYPFEFVIASLHQVFGKDPYYTEVFTGREDREVYRKYFEELLENIYAFDAYHVVGHIDYVVRYGAHKAEQYCYHEYADILDEILRHIIKKDRGIEINTGGLYKGLDFPNPHYDVIKRYYELGGKIITFGSDAHDPVKIGHEFSKVSDHLKTIGFRYRAEFQKNVPIFIQL